MTGDLLTMSGIALSFAGNAVLQGVSFSVRQGTVIGLIGPNGAGKTSLFNCITGFYRPQEGRILFDGQDLARMKPHRVTRAGIARTFQNVRLFREMSVRENVMSGMHCRTRSSAVSAILGTRSHREEERAIREVSEACLSFVGLRSDWEAIATTLPYGHQRLVELARALATRPKLVLLDEPAAGLNKSEKHDLISLIAKIRNELGISVLLIEHDMGLVMQVSDRISVLDHGVTIAEGTADQIRTNPKVIEAYLGRNDQEISVDL